MTTCPSCNAKIAVPAAEGGIRIKNRYLRITTDGRIVVGCEKCGTELEASPLKVGTFVLHNRKAASQ